MKALQLVSYGNAVEGLCVTEIREPDAPGEGEVLVGIEYAPINVNDLMVAWGVYAWRPALPETLGNEGSGLVLATGPGVDGLSVGDRVVLPFMSRTWRQRLLVPAGQLVRVPSEADPVQASMLAINAVTAAMLLDDHVDLQPGDGVAFNAATSGLGRWIAALARRRGLRTVGLVRRPEDERIVHADADDVLVVHDGEDDADVASRLSGVRVRLALDGVGGASAGRLARLLAPGGRLIAYGAASRRPMEVSAQFLIFNGISVQGFYEGAAEHVGRIVPTLRTLVGLIGPGGVRQPVAAVIPIEDASEAVRRAVSGEKIVLDLGGAR